MNIYNPQIECMDRESMRALQLERLKKTVRYTYDNVEHYRNKLSSAGVKPEDIRSLEDIRYIPFSTKADMRDNYPFGLLARPLKDMVRVHASSGTTGKPTVVAYTKKDLEMWAECIARLAAAAGATDEDIAQITFGYTLFTGAFGLHYGLEKLGATVIPISSGNTERQIMIMKDFGSTLLVGTPSYALYLAETAERLGVGRDELKLRLGMFGGEGITEAMRAEIESRLGISATQNYGLSEVLGPGVSGECEYKCGQHINEDCFYPEIINPQTGEIMLGDIVLSMEAARAQAEEYGHSLEREAVYLCVHSVLHLLGYDHIQPADKALMRAREEEIMNAFGLSREATASENGPAGAE